MSTNTPKSITFRTVPFRSIPGFKSFISRTSLLRIGFGMFSRGSRAGFSSSFRISVSVISPIPSSSAIFFLSLTRFSSPPAAACGTEGSAFVFWDCCASSVTPPMAAASAFPMAVLVFLMTIFCFLLFLRFFALSCFSAFTVFADAAFLWISFRSSMEMPSLSRSFIAAS